MPRPSAVVPEEMMMMRMVDVDIPSYLLLSQLELGESRQLQSSSWSWVDSMRASSPNRRKSCTVSNHNDDGGGDDDHNSWRKQHPSALASIEKILEKAKGKQIAMFLDYDGTLSPIVKDPERAYMSDSMRCAVKDVAKLFPTAVVSGRCIDKVYNFVKLGELYYAGSHGMDIKGPNKGTKHTKAKAKPILFQPASDFLPMINEVYNVLLDTTKSTPGAKVENNKFCISVHFRCVDEKRWSKLADQVKSVLVDYPMLCLTQGRKVLEIRPSIKWDKGKALEFLLESLGFDDSNEVFPIYIGDDRTDEDAFKVLREREQGTGILVSKFPKETRASYSLQDPTEVMDFLHRLADWKRASLKS